MFYEGDGPIKVNSPFMPTDMRDRILSPLVLKLEQDNQKMAWHFIKHSKLPTEVLGLCVPEMNDYYVSQSEYRADSYPDASASLLKSSAAPGIKVGFIYKDLKTFETFIKHLVKLGYLVELNDIVGYRYSILSFNSDPRHIYSLDNSITNESFYGSSLHQINLKISKDGQVYNIGLLISKMSTKLNGRNLTEETYPMIFNTVKEYFEQTICNDKLKIELFVEFCRGKVKKCISL